MRTYRIFGIIDLSKKKDTYYPIQTEIECNAGKLVIDHGDVDEVTLIGYEA